MPSRASSALQRDEVATAVGTVAVARAATCAASRGCRGMRVAVAIGMRCLVLAALLGCTSTDLRVEPNAIDLDVVLGEPAPGVGLRVFLDDKDVTDEASFALAGRPLGTLAGSRWTSDGRTGGAATI